MKENLIILGVAFALGWFTYTIVNAKERALEKKTNK